MRYTVVLQREEDVGFVAKVPALAGCVSQGDTRDEAIANIREAAELYIEDCEAAGDPIPTEAETAQIRFEDQCLMSRLPRGLSGQEVRRALEKAGFVVS